MTDHVELGEVLAGLDRWLQRYGETSFDHQSYFAGPLGGRAKGLYYRHRLLGTVAVAPMIFSEAFFPEARRLFWKKMRFPIADAHYAMGYAFLHGATGEERHYRRAVHFLKVLQETRSPGFRHYCWGYPFDWVTRGGVMKRNTPFITSTPYVYEAFAAVHASDGRDEWRAVMRSIADHALEDIRDIPAGDGAFSSGYSPDDREGGVINASAYRAFLLTRAARDFGDERCRVAAAGNLRFVLRNQNEDGSWHYAVDGVRDFVDHFHTCFVMKALAKIERLTGDAECSRAVERGLRYYEANLVDEEGLPKPFAKRPRLTVYRTELYDIAECLNLGQLLRGRSRGLDRCVEATLRQLFSRWRKRDGSFRSRRLLLGWDNVPMHRWGQSQLFRSLAFIAAEGGGVPAR